MSPVPAAPAWLLGGTRWQELASRVPAVSGPRSLALPEGGWYLLRGADGSLMVDAGPHGALAGGHSHADALALDLTVGGRAVIVDPGTGAYVGPWRDGLRATAAHSSLSMADGTGSATPAGQFRWGRWPRVTVRHWSEGAGWAALEAEHDGFAAQMSGSIHRRTVVFRDGWGWLVLDRLLGATTEARLHFQLDWGLEVSVDQGTVTARLENGQPVLRIVSDGGEAVTLRQGLVSHAYGTARESPSVERLLSPATARRGVATLLTTTADGAVSVDTDSSSPAWLWQGNHPAARVAIRADGVTTVVADDFSLTLD